MDNNANGRQQLKPRYRKASSDGQYAVQENGAIRLVWFRRLGGWGSRSATE